MEILAMIPARKGSKRLPNKNMMKLCGKPLIDYTIQEAKKSKYINQIMINTDDKEIIKLYKGKGVIIYERPRKLRGDNITAEQLIDDVKGKIYFKIIVLLQPTSPLRTVEDIDKCIEMLLNEDTQFDSVISVERLPTFYTFIPNGAVYAIWSDFQRYNDNMGLFTMPHERSVDIDTMLDFKFAELLMKERNEKENSTNNRN